MVTEHLKHVDEMANLYFHFGSNLKYFIVHLHTLIVQYMERQLQDFMFHNTTMYIVYGKLSKILNTACLLFLYRYKLTCAATAASAIDDRILTDPLL